MEAGTLAPPSDAAKRKAEDAARRESGPGTVDETVPPAEDDGTLRLVGGEQLSFNVGGKKPTGSSLTITGGKFEVEGQYPKGTTLGVEVKGPDGKVLFSGAAVVDFVGFKDKADAKTGQVVASERQHKARISKAAA